MEYSQRCSLGMFDLLINILGILSIVLHQCVKVVTMRKGAWCALSRTNKLVHVKSTETTEPI